MSTNEKPEDIGEPVEVVGNNAAMILDTLETAAGDIDELAAALCGMSDLPEDVEQFADALRDLGRDLHQHVKTLRKMMKVVFVEE